MTRSEETVTTMLYRTDPQNEPSTFDCLVEAVARVFEIHPRMIYGRSRATQHSHPRQVVMYLAREYLDMTYTEIGERLSGRDHSTIVHGVAQVESVLRASRGANATMPQFQRTLIAVGEWQEAVRRA